MNAKIFLFVFVAVFAGFIFSIIYIVNLQIELNNTITELMRLKSEESFAISENRMIMEALEAKPPARLLEEIRKKKESAKDSFVIYIEPKVDIEALSSKFAKKQESGVKRHISVWEKKKRFIEMALPVIKEVHDKLWREYIRVEKLASMQDSTITEDDFYFLNRLFEKYKIENRNIRKLLIALKPHPNSLVLAQAALESAWGTSRLFKKSNNLFGIWSFNKNEKRIKVTGTKNVYLRKYDSLKESVEDYFYLLATGSKYEAFREVRYRVNNPYKLAEFLKNYSQLKDEYVRRIQVVIRVNNFQKYDD